MKRQLSNAELHSYSYASGWSRKRLINSTQNHEKFSLQSSFQPDNGNSLKSAAKTNPMRLQHTPITIAQFQSKMRLSYSYIDLLQFDFFICSNFSSVLLTSNTTLWNDLKSSNHYYHSKTSSLSNKDFQGRHISCKWCSRPRSYKTNISQLSV